MQTKPVRANDSCRDRRLPTEGLPRLVARFQHATAKTVVLVVVIDVVVGPISIAHAVSALCLEQPPVVIKVSGLIPLHHGHVVPVLLRAIWARQLQLPTRVILRAAIIVVVAYSVRLLATGAQTSFLLCIKVTVSTYCEPTPKEVQIIWSNTKTTFISFASYVSLKAKISLAKSFPIQILCI